MPRLSKVRRRIRRTRRDADHGRNEFSNNQYKLPSVGECGNPRISFEPPPFTPYINKQNSVLPYIRNGTCSPYGAFPWTVQIQIRDNGRYNHQCGGSLISDTHVLTAGHCFSGTADPSKMRVVVGQYDLNKIDPEEMAFEIERVMIHPRYQDDGPFSHDLALVKIRRKAGGAGVMFSDRVSPICLPGQATRVPDNTQCVISGWGKLLHDAALSPESLRQLVPGDPGFHDLCWLQGRWSGCLQRGQWGPYGLLCRWKIPTHWYYQLGIWVWKGSKS